MKIYITKYALTKGIIEVEGEFQYPDYVPSGWIIVKDLGNFYKNKDAFESWEEALKKGEKMRKAKILSIEKSLERVKNIIL